jgi:hypothetical protein
MNKKEFHETIMMRLHENITIVQCRAIVKEINIFEKLPRRGIIHADGTKISILKKIVKYLKHGIIDTSTEDKRKCVKCGGRASYGCEKSTHCGKCKEPGMEIQRARLCQEPGCKKQCFFGYQGGKPTHCVKHKFKDMIDVKRTTGICEHKNCKKRGSYKGENNKLYCKEHIIGESKRVWTKICSFPDCKEYGYYGNKGDTKNIRCRDHKIKGMIRLSNKRCRGHPNCRTVPIYKYPGKVGEWHCYDHKLPGMVNVVHKRCEENKCEVLPSYNYPSKKKPARCLLHKLPGMVNVIAKICIVKDCSTECNFNYPGLQPEYCVIHKSIGMINTVRRYCMIKNCEELATHGNGRELFRCQLHKHDDDIAMFVNPCVKCGERFIVDLEGLCVACHPKSIYRQCTKQKEVEDFLDKQDYAKRLESRDKIINIDIGRYRPDEVYSTKTHKVIVEVDEYQHKKCHYSEDIHRMVKVSRGYDVPCFWIRYNPDLYDKSIDTPKEERLTLLSDCIRHILNSTLPNRQNIYVLYLYYDGFDKNDLKIINIT